MHAGPPPLPQDLDAATADDDVMIRQSVNLCDEHVIGASFSNQSSAIDESG